jgi:hypothetical protein
LLVDLVTWLPRDARVGQAIVFYNIAAIYAITNDVEKAFKHFNLVCIKNKYEIFYWVRFL